MATTERINLSRRADSLNVSPAFSNYSKVVIHIDDDEAVEVGDDTGRTLEVNNPFGTEEIARDMLDKLKGYQYQPFSASGAFLDPAAEIGDGVGIKNVYGGIYQRERTFGRMMKADIAAPHDEEINHEYKFETPQERKFKREMGDVRASILIQSDRITAEVSRATAAEGNLSSQITQTATEIRASVVAQNGGRNASGSFSWSLTSSGHRWYANGSSTPVMAVTKDGLEVNGKVTATSGFIGSGSNGFTISARAIYNGMTSLNDTTHNGIYIGTDGIALGKGAFKVTSAGAVTAKNLAITGGSISIGSNFTVNSSGNVTANNMKLTGTLNIGGTNITAAALRSGAQSAYSNGSTWSTGAGYGYNYNRATENNTSSYPSYFTAGYIYAKTGMSVNGSFSANSLSGLTLRVGGYDVSWKQTTIAGTTIYYLGR